MMKNRRAFSLIEVLISLGLSTLVLGALFLLLRGGTRQAELSTAQIFLGQKTREAVEDAQAVIASTVSPLTESAVEVYSPTPGCSQDPNQYPNVYCLDFVSCCDFLDNRFPESPELTDGYLDRRGGVRFRYRIKFDPSSEKLILERLRGDSPANNPVPDTTRVPRTLGQGIERITFGAVGNTIHMTVGGRTVRKDGRTQGGLTITDGRTSTDPNADVKNRARTLKLFTVVAIPARTTR